MFRPQIQKTRTLFVIAFINICFVVVVSNSLTYKEYDNVNLRYDSTQFMSSCIESIKDIADLRIVEEDYYQTGLIGLEQSRITTVLNNENIENILNSKIITTNSNFAAFMVLLFEEIGLEKGDSIAISMTGSFPGANIATLSACKSMDLNPVILSSIGSSSWGANREDLTWVQIENHLYNNKLIDYESIAVSIGGENDLGDNISDEGIEIIEGIILENNESLVNESTLDLSISKKINLLGDINKYKAFINIGGGASSLGSGLGKKYIREGIISPLIKDEIQEIYYENEDAYSYYSDFKKSIAYKFLDNDIYLINIKNINSLVSQFGMSYLNDRGLNNVNEGLLFYEVEKFNVNVIWFVLVFSVLISFIVGVYSHLEIQKKMKEDEVDSIL
tara:strand:- start:157 stop:1326 length:1170 start_codon:yes stop_codon:yes gene_type:complete